MSSLKDLYFAQLQDLYDAEKRLVEALPKMEASASSPELKAAVSEHLVETEGQVQRLEQIFARHDKSAKRETCKAMKGLIEESDHEMKEWDDPSVKDAAIIASAQRVEHYEIAGYGSAKTFAQMLGFAEDVEILEETLAEEKACDSKLNEVALGSVNVDALLADEEDFEDSEQPSSRTQRPGSSSSRTVRA